MNKPFLIVSLFMALWVGFLSAFPAIADSGDYQYYMKVEITNENTSSKTTRIAIPINAKGLIEANYIQDDIDDVSIGTHDFMAPNIQSSNAKWYTDVLTINPQSTTTRTFYMGDPDATRDQKLILQNGDTATVADDPSLDITTNLEVGADVYLDNLPGVEKHIVDKDGAYGLTVDASNYNFTVAGVNTSSSYSSSSDGYVYASGPYTTAQAATTGTVSAAATTARIGQEYTTSTSSWAFMNMNQALCGYSGYYQRLGQRLNSFPASVITSVSFMLGKYGSPTGTLSVNVRSVSGDTLLGTIGTKDVSTLTTTTSLYSFNSSPINITGAQDIRVLAEFSGGDGSNWVNFGYYAGSGSNMTGYQTGAYTDFISTGCYYSVSYTVYTVDRAALYFDTSALPDSCTITNATLSLYGQADTSTTDFNIVVANGQPTYPHDPLVTGDYSKANYSGTGNDTFSTSGFTIAGYNNLTLSSTGKGWISKTGTTKLLIWSSEDVAASAPTTHEYVTVYTQEQTGTGNDPKLTITYSDSSITKTVSTAATADAWKTVKGTYDGSNVKIYVDGVEKDSEAMTESIAANENNVTLGESYTLMLDDVYISSAGTNVLQLDFEPEHWTSVSYDAYSSTSDGYLTKTDATYLTAHNTASATSATTTGNINVGQTTGYSIYRSALYLDTSSIPDNVNITGATLHLYGVANSSDTDVDIVITNGQPTYPHDPLVVADYNYTYYSEDGGSMSTEDWSITGYNDIDLNADGLEWISKTGTTKFLLRSSQDIDAEAPTAPAYVTFYSADESGTTYDPYLTVTYDMYVEDQSASDNDAAIILSGNLTGITVNVLALTPVSENEASATTQESISPFVTETPAAPSGGLYGGGDYSKIPGAAVINDILTDAGIPLSFFWIPVICGICIILGLLVFGKSRSLLAVAIAVGLVLVFTAGIGMIPWWTLIVFGFLAMGMLVMQRSYGF